MTDYNIGHTGIAAFSNLPAPPLPKLYSIQFNYSQVNILAFNQYLTDNKFISSYWNYVPGLYFVRSHLTASMLTDRFSAMLSPAFFVIAAIDPANINGRLPQEGWEWFYKTV